MKLIIVLPSRDSERSAGVRIRYLRMSAALESAGSSLSLIAIDDFDPQQAQCDAVVFSKCYDARALVCAVLLRRRGLKVGVDLFDDYFSQKSDSRLIRFRSWLEQILPLSDFVLCSTAVLAEVVLGYREDIPIHILNDPAPAFDSDVLAETLGRKFDAARSDGVLRTLWFGMGDNPYFPVGLADLAAFGSTLRDIAAAGVAVDLTILTNPRALSPAGLTLAAQLPVPVKICEWSEEREAELLDQAFLCFLPVGAQPFSIAKSLNRAVTALAAGCQVLSVGYPLYDPLEQFIYRNTADLLEDWGTGRWRLSPASAGDLQRRVSELASAEGEADSLISFLKPITESVSNSPSALEPIFLLHGLGTSQGAHHLVKRSGGFSVGTPFCNETMDFDVVVEVTASGEAALAVSASALSKVRDPLRTTARPAARTGRRKFWQLGDQPLASMDDDKPPLSWQMAMYGPVMQSASAIHSKAFGDGLHLISEDSSLPVEAGRL